jgi:hypothetical protein
MAAENNTDFNTDAAVTDGSATTPATKRKYAPRRPKGTQAGNEETNRERAASGCERILL